jgi:hypothetical protein
MLGVAASARAPPESKPRNRIVARCAVIIEKHSLSSATLVAFRPVSRKSLAAA